MEIKKYPEKPVLLVDDEQEYLQSASFSLRSSGINNVIKCQDSREVMGLLEEKKASAIVLDNLMPFLNGVDLLPQIVNSYPDLPVIMLTAINEIETAVECMKQGAFDYLVKPVEKQRLITSVRRAIEFEEMRKQNKDLTETLRDVNRELVEKAQEQEKLVQHLKITAGQLQSILDTSRGVLLLVDGNQKIVEVNKNTKAYFNLDSSEIIGKDFNYFVDRIEDCFEDRDLFHKVLKHKSELTHTERLHDFENIMHSEYRLLALKPVRRIINVFTTPVDFHDEKCKGNVWGFSDITTFLKADEQLHTIVEASPISLLISRLEDGKIIYANNNLGDMAGYQKDEVIGRQTTDFYYDPAERDALIQSLTENGIVNNFELKLKKKSGGFLWTVISLVLTKLYDERVIVGGLYDISPQKEAFFKVEEARRNLLEAQSQLVQSEKMASLGSLVAGVAHEINNPVGAVNSSADVAKRGMEKVRGILETIESLDELKENGSIQKLLNVVGNSQNVISEGCSRISEIVKSLKNFSRIDEAENQDADIHEGLESTLTLVHHQFKRRIEVVRDYGELPLVNCYPNQLNQVFMNLLVNASQAIKDKGKVTIKTRVESENIVVRISDNGKGIPAGNIENIFDPGFTTKGVGVGTGLGLSICYNIIEKHKGKISVQSKPGETVFKIEIPL
ncbi:MAG: response regulator [Fibrobacteria bacterium]|nr:response regulator [Fibrobacteria bacterium]